MSGQQMQGLRVKSYFASSFEEAMKQAQRDMGDDALLLNSREALPENRHMGAWEVVFGTTSEIAPEPVQPVQPVQPKPLVPVKPAQPTAAGPVKPSQPKAAFTAVAAAPPAPVAQTPPPAGGEDIRKNLEQIQNLLKRLANSSPNAAAGEPAIAEGLIEVGLEKTLATEIEEAVRERVTNLQPRRPAAKTRNAPSWDPELVLRETVMELGDRFTVKPEIGDITALVGPPGCGKTTTIVKLAIHQGLMAGRPVRLFCVESQKIGAVDELQTYATILDVPFQSFQAAAELEHALDSMPFDGITLIDTPGFSGAGLAAAATELALLLRRRQDIDTHLVLTASMRSADLKRTVDRFEIFAPAKLLFTKLDETDSFAGIYREAACRRQPLSFFSDGLTVPENLAPATKERVVASLVRHLPECLSLVA